MELLEVLAVPAPELRRPDAAAIEKGLGVPAVHALTVLPHDLVDALLDLEEHGRRGIVRGVVAQAELEAVLDPLQRVPIKAQRGRVQIEGEHRVAEIGVPQTVWVGD
ncbi:MAG: hypothetical protein V2A76_12715 [Planctomycetota bacterium]